MGDTGHAYLFDISEGRQGVIETLDIMVRLAREYAIDPRIVMTARSLLLGLPPKAWRREVKALFNFVQKHIRYTPDTADVELIMTPTRLLDVRAGDCDDKSLLLATLLRSIDKPARFKAIGFQPGELSHVYVQARIGEEWISLDPSEAYPMGWEAPDARDIAIKTI